MKHPQRLLPLLCLTALSCALLTVPALAAGGEAEAAAPMLYGTFFALLPPILAIVLALVTKEAYSSLALGVLVGAFLACDFHPVRTLDTVIQDGLIQAISDNAGIFIFLVLLGTVVALVNAAGGSAAFGRWAEKNIKTKAGAQIATFVLGILIFIDDYFNCLTVGSVMRPVTDSHRISRAKLAFLIDATAAPVCMIAPVSSWAAAVSGTAEGLNTGISGIQLFIRAIPYNLYSLLTFVFILLLVLLGLDYGPMRQYERRARLTGDVGGLAGSENEEGSPDGRILDLLLPVLVLIAACTLGMLYIGGFFGTNFAVDTLDYQWDFIGAFGNTDAFLGLPWGSIIALVLIVAFLVLRGRVSFKDAMACIPKGFNAMVPAITILTLAVSLKNMTNGALGAAVFVKSAMENAAPNLANMLPAVIFLVAVILAFASGTSWGTFGILIPIVTSIFSPDSPLMIIGISACLAGAVCGDHCSPISDTTIMASAGAQVEHVDHVSTQLPYALTVACVSFIGFIVAGIYQNLYLTWGVSAGLLAVFLLLTRVVVFFIERREKKRDDEAAAIAAANRASEPEPAPEPEKPEPEKPAPVVEPEPVAEPAPVVNLEKPEETAIPEAVPAFAELTPPEPEEEPEPETKVEPFFIPEVHVPTISEQEEQAKALEAREEPEEPDAAPAEAEAVSEEPEAEPEERETPSVIAWEWEPKPERAEEAETDETEKSGAESAE